MRILPLESSSEDKASTLSEDHAPRSVSTSPEDLQTFSRRIVSELLARSGITPAPFPPPHFTTVDTLVRETLRTWDMGGIPPARVEEKTAFGLLFGTACYAHAHPDTQVLMALLIFCAACIDDGDVPAGAQAAFTARLLAGRAQAHPVLDGLVGVLARAPDVLNAYSAAVVAADTVNFVNSTRFEGLLGEMRLSGAAGLYPTYKRHKNGLNEVTAGTVWDKFAFPDVATHIQAIPDATLFIMYTNDVISFYKEELAGETENFVHDVAHVTGQDPRVVVQELADKAVACIHNVRDILEGEKEREAWESFLAGYLCLHLTAPRYHMGRLLGDEVQRT
ncbi:hypothetical protein PsYK624_127010 [Phanerochaete sordida]|uniref:Terpenoid synthase n=1 Tax=Phanerochaete sordida TaxID=48140 RepID=A0A9P3LJB3_9APHY|nr:hypothetical protein PsYK624_127010 [Phanerochaete sordida]